jgi:hypothetical protein
MEESIPYQAYLVRLWPTRRAGLVKYRVTLDQIGAGDHRDFADLDGLVAFLQAQETQLAARVEKDVSDPPVCSID